MLHTSPTISCQLSVRYMTANISSPTSRTTDVMAHADKVFLWHACLQVNIVQSSFCPYFCPSSGSLWIWMRCSSTTGNHGGSVGQYSLQFKQDQRNTIKKNILEVIDKFIASFLLNPSLRYHVVLSVSICNCLLHGYICHPPKELWLDAVTASLGIKHWLLI